MKHPLQGWGLEPIAGHKLRALRLTTAHESSSFMYFTSILELHHDSRVSRAAVIPRVADRNPLLPRAHHVRGSSRLKSRMTAHTEVNVSQSSFRIRDNTSAFGSRRPAVPGRRRDWGGPCAPRNRCGSSPVTSYTPARCTRAPAVGFATLLQRRSGRRSG